MDLENLVAFITWIVYSGGALLIASWILDKIPAFVALAEATKKLINQALSVVLAVGFYAVLKYVPPDVFAAIDPWFKIIVGVLVAYAGQQVVHRLSK